MGYIWLKTLCNTCTMPAFSTNVLAGVCPVYAGSCCEQMFVWNDATPEKYRSIFPISPSPLDIHLFLCYPKMKEAAHEPYKFGRGDTCNFVVLAGGNSCGQDTGVVVMSKRYGRCGICGKRGRLWLRFWWWMCYWCKTNHDRIAEKYRQMGVN